MISNGGQVRYGNTTLMVGRSEDIEKLTPDRRLIIGIIDRAVKDWMMLATLKPAGDTMTIFGYRIGIDELRRYFNSKWFKRTFPEWDCMTAEEAYERLEDKLRRARS